MTAAAQPTPPGTADRSQLDDIQGDIIGFKNDLRRLLFVTFPDAASAQAFTTAMADEVDNAHQVLDANARYAQRAREHHDQIEEIDDWVNIGYSLTGLTKLGAPGLDAFPEEFRQGMAARAPQLGDIGPSDPATWELPFAPNPAGPPDAVIFVAADTPDALDRRSQAIQTIMEAHGVTTAGGPQAGQVRPDTNAGHEHFGFKDGISQPSIGGLTKSSKGGPDIAAGEFLVGYLDQAGDVSGQGTPDAPAPQPGQPGYPGSPTPGQPPLPDWTRNGSFGVYRKLQQNVGGFEEFCQTAATGMGLTPDQLAAKLVGRWKDGAPMERVPGEPAAIDPSASDPGQLTDTQINDFDYSTDPDGTATPRAAHIRKMWPRAENPPGAVEANRHRMLRRGIPYGPEFAPDEPPYGQSVPPEQDRGLLFVCYQASIARSFEFVQQTWANQATFPEPGDGLDPIIGQGTGPGLLIPPHGSLTTAQWVVTRGGMYFFTPSVTGLRTLGGA